MRVDVPGGEEELLFTLRRGALVTGRVTDAEGEAVPGVRVRAGRVHGISDAEGRFRLAGVEPGRRMLVARHLEYDELVREIDVGPGENRVDLVLEGGSPVAGIVVTEGGGAIDGAHLWLRYDPTRGDAREYTAVSAEDGSFQFPGVVDGSYDLRVEADGYAPLVTERAARVEGDPVTGLRVVLVAGTEVRGRLLGLRFEEVAVAGLEADDGRIRRTGRIDHEGCFRVSDLGPGLWRLHAWAPGGREAEATLAIEPGDRALHRDLRFGGVSVTGRVTHEGEPVAEATVELAGRDVGARRSATTDWDGRFRIADVEPGRYVLSVASRREMLLHNDEVELLADRELAIDIVTGRLSGRVVSVADGAPLREAWVAARRLLAKGEEPGSIIAVTTDRQGAFQIGRLTAGSYRLEVRHDGYTPWEERLEVAPGEVVEGLEIALEPAAGLQVHLHSAVGPPSLARVAVAASDGAPVLTGAYPLPPDGRLDLTSVPAGSWRLRLAAPGAAVTGATVTVPGPPVELVLVPETGLRVQVPALVDENGVGMLSIRRPGGESFVGLEPGGGLQDRWRLEGGAGTVEGLPAGTWELTVTSADGRLWQTTVVAQSGSATTVVLP